MRLLWNCAATGQELGSGTKLICAAANRYVFPSGPTKSGLLVDAGGDMEKSALPPDSAKHLQELADFFDSQSDSQSDSQLNVQGKPVLCEACGTKMDMRPFDFWFFGTDMKWTPVCPMCGPKGPWIAEAPLTGWYGLVQINVR